MRLLSLSSRLLIDEQETNLFRRCPDCRRLVNVLAIASSLDRVLTSTLLHGRLLYRRRMRERAAVTTSTNPRSTRSTSAMKRATTTSSYGIGMRCRDLLLRGPRSSAPRLLPRTPVLSSAPPHAAAAPCFACCRSTWPRSSTSKARYPVGVYEVSGQRCTSTSRPCRSAT